MAPKDAPASMAILVLGGDGFVGRSFIERQTIASEMTILSRFPCHPELHELVEPRIEKLDEALFEGIDVVFNCIGVAHVDDRKNDALFRKINTDFALQAARLAKKMNVSRFVHMSSVSVYGDAAYIDDQTQARPLTNYGRSKLEADEGLLALQSPGFAVTLLRPPMLYGPGAPGNMRRLVELVRMLPVIPLGNAREERASLYIDNFVILSQEAIRSGWVGPVLLTDKRMFATRDLIVLIAQALDRNPLLVNFPFKGAFRRLVPGLYRKLFGALEIRSQLLESLDPAALRDPAEGLIAMVKTMK